MSTQTTIQLPFTTSHAFIVGINDYQHLTPLSTAVNDARVLGEVLAQDHGYQVHPPLLNATRTEIMQLLEQDLPNLVKEQDRVLFYFAGHGIALDSDDNPKGYLVPVDAQPGDNETLIAMDDFHRAITGLPCQHGMLILDCCFAGAFKWSTGFRDIVFDLPGIIYEERFHQYAQDPAWQVITSSASDQKAVDVLSDRTLGMRSDKSGEHSPFAAALLAGLAGEADTVPKDTGDGVITATELYTYLRDRVEDETSEVGKRQSPAMFSLQRHDKGQYIFLAPNHRLNLPPIPRRNPFMGLKSYNEDDRALFYGRDRVVKALHELSTRQPLIVVSGASGTGKSSVIKAGLLPLLREEGWKVLPVIRPGKEPMVSLQEVLPKLQAELRQATTPCLLIVDQYEELLTQCLNPDDRVAFETQLADGLRENDQLRIVISIRSDFEPQFEKSALAKWWQPGRYVVPVFSQDELREVIIKPTTQEVLFFEPDSLVDKLIEAVNQAPGALPLLSFTLSELYHAYLNSGRTNRAFTLEDYEKLGGVIGALRTRASAIYDDLDQDHQDSMRKLMLRMVSLEGGELASRRVASDDLVFSDPKETERLQTVAQQLVTARLISTGLDAQGQNYYEPAHDALVRAWARLWEWIKAQGEGRMGLMYKLSLAVTDYQDNPTNEYLWNDDPRLDVLLADLRSKGHSFNAAEEAFLQKSDALRQRNKRRRWGIIAAVMIGLLGLAVFALYEQGIAKKALAQVEIESKHALIQADSALAAQGRAEKFSIYAEAQRDSALAANQLAIEFGDEAQRQANVALVERDRARQAQTRAEHSAREAKSAAAAAKARGMLGKDPTVALNLALAAYHLVPNEESSGALHDILNNQEDEYYKTNLIGHQKKVKSIAVSPNGQTILTASQDNTAILWSLSGEKLQTFRGHKGWVQSAVFSPNGQAILTGSVDRTAKLWSLSGEELQTFAGHKQWVHSVAFSPNGEAILTGSWDNTAKLWSLSGEELQTFTGHDGKINSIAFSHSGQRVLTGSSDKTAKLWSLSGEKLQTFTGHKDEVRSVAFTPNDQTVLTGSGDNTARLWSLSGRELQVYEGHSREVRSVSISRDGNSILTGSYDKTAKLWSLSGEELHTFTLYKDYVESVAFSADGQFVLIGGGDATVKVWPLSNEKLQVFEGHDDGVNSVGFSPDGQTILTGSKDQTAKRWSLSGSIIETFAGHEDEINDIVFSTDGQRILTGSTDGTAVLWNLSGKELQKFEGHEGRVTSVAFSPDDQMILTGSYDNTAKLWSLSGELIQTFVLPESGITSVAFSPDGQTIFTGGYDSTGKIWSLSGEELQSFEEHSSSIFSAVFSPDGRSLLTGSGDNTAKLWSLSGKELQTFVGHKREINSVAFSPDGQMILTGSTDENAKLWSLAGELLQTFHGHKYGVLGVAFSPLNQAIITGGNDEQVKRWRNLYAEYRAGTLWDRVYKLTPEEQAKYGIDWEY